LKNSNSEQFLGLIKALKSLIFLAACCFIFSCSDQGCIDADDFGEYESETIEVTANSAQNTCPYDPSKEITDPLQGPTLIQCFTAGDASVTDETGATKTSDQGCQGFDDAKLRAICVDMCVQECLIKSTSNSVTSKPNWSATNKRSSSINYGVTIRPGAEIMVTATGEVNLGDSLNYDDVYVKADNSLPNSYTEETWKNLFYDVNSGQSLDFKFSGEWNDGTNTVGAGTSSLSATGNQTSDSKIYNGTRRLVAYLIPHPTGYDFDNTQTSEKSGSKGVPLLPDPVSWKCSYSGTDSTYEVANEANCYNNTENGYTGNQYTNVSDQLAAEVFQISSQDETDILGSYGGVVKWSGAGLMPDNRDDSIGYDELSSLSCDNNSCSLPSNITQDGTYRKRAALLEQTSENGELLNPSSSSSAKYAFKVSFKNINPACSTAVGLKVKVINSAGNVLDTGSPDSGNTGDYRTISVSNSGWSSDHISLESNQKIVYNTTDYSATCRKSIVAKFRKYHDIEIKKSGFVNFTTLGAISGNCIIKGRIINPLGSFLKVGNVEPDFYEYGNFLTPSQSPQPSNSPTDPLNSVSLTYSNSSTLNWTQDFFVRKGQTIRFSPESWDKTFTTGGGLTRQCGSGMIMRIIPRPALLCRGKSSSNDELVNNPNCLQDYATSTTSTTTAGELLGCQATASECSDSSSDSYCPIDACKNSVLNCVKGTLSNGYTKTGCALSSTINDSASCSIDENSGYTTSSCTKCSQKSLANASLSAKLAIDGVDKCYDLESYTGKVSNIPANGFSSTDLENKDIAKGAIKIGAFNGLYGNFESFSDTGEKDSFNNTIFQIKSPVIFSISGRLRFMMLDGSDFSYPQAVSSYSNNSSSTSNYNGSNGFKITPSGMLTYSNGQWLEARLCKESGDETYDCSGSDPVALTGQPQIIEITTPTISGEKPNITSGYKFDPYGNLIRTSSPTSADCKLDPNGTDTKAGSYFYCHTFQFFSQTDLEDKSKDAQNDIEKDIQRLRLTFRVLDPEIANCKISDPSASSGFDGIRLKNAYFESQTVITDPNDPNKTIIVSIPENIGSLCPANKNPGPDRTNDCQKEFYCGNKYSNNSGNYYVNVKVKSPVSNGSSDIIGSVIKPVIEIMDGPKRDCFFNGSSTYNGSKKTNPSWDQTNPANSDQICSDSEPLSGSSACAKQYYCEESEMGQAERVYKLLITDTRYKAIVNVSLIMMFTFYGLSFLMGVSELNHSELTNRIIKIGLIYLFIGETGWYWFDQIIVKFFKNGADYLSFVMASSFDSSPDIASAIKTGDYYDKSVLFRSVDQVFNMFFSPAIQKKISALLFASIFGWAYLLIILSSFMLYVYSVANAVLLYLTSQVFISILFTLGPIFFVFTLFSQTKDMFNNWLNQLIGLSLQQIFLLTTLAFFNMLMYEVVKMSLGYKICWDEVWTINIITRISLMSFWTIASLPPRTDTQSQVGNIGNPDGIPSLFSILFIWVIASLMNKFIGFMTDLAASIGGSMKASDLGSGVMDVAKQVKGKIGEMKSDLWQRSGGKDLMQSMDKALFNSGAKADQEKAQKKAQKKDDKKKLRKMKKDGKKAVSEYKKDSKNMAALSKMSKEDQQKTLDKVKKDAEIKSGVKQGLSEDDAKKLQNKKGFDLGGSDNLAEIAASYAYERVRDGSFKESLSDKSAKTAFTNSEMKAGMKGLTKEERAEVKKGNLDFERSNTGKVMKAAGDIRKATLDPVASRAASAAGSAAKSAYQAAKFTIDNRNNPEAFKEKFALAKASVAKSANNTIAAIANTPKNIQQAGESAIKYAGESLSEAKKETINLANRAAQGVSDLKDSALNKASQAASAVRDVASSAKQSLNEGAEFAMKNPGEAAKIALKSAVKSPYTLAKGSVMGAGMAISAASKAAETSTKALGRLAEAVTRDKEYDKAEEQLVKAGIINDYEDGTKWARSSEEKALIKSRAKENAKLSKAEKPKFDVGGLADFELEETRQNTLDEAEDKGFFERIKMKAGANLARNAGFGNDKKQARMKAENSVREKAKGAIESSLDSANQELDTYTQAAATQKEEVNNIRAALTKHRGSDEYKAREKEIAKLETIASKTFTEEERKANPEEVKKGERLAKAARSKIESLKTSDVKEVALNEQLKKSSSAYHVINDKKSAVQSKVNKYKEMLKEFKEEDKEDRAIETDPNNDEVIGNQVPEKPKKPINPPLPKNPKFNKELLTLMEENEENEDEDDEDDDEGSTNSLTPNSNKTKKPLAPIEEDLELDEEEEEDNDDEGSNNPSPTKPSGLNKSKAKQTLTPAEEVLNEDDDGDDESETESVKSGAAAKKPKTLKQNFMLNEEELDNEDKDSEEGESESESKEKAPRNPVQKINKGSSSQQIPSNLQDEENSDSEEEGPEEESVEEESLPLGDNQKVQRSSNSKPSSGAKQSSNKLSSSEDLEDDSEDSEDPVNNANDLEFEDFDEEDFDDKKDK
jgi:type IV secretory pathway VirB6-like protein